MSTTIFKRTVYYEKLDGNPFRFSDWAHVVARDVGECVEPFSLSLRLFSNSEYDPTDDMSRIDLLQNIDMNKETVILSGSSRENINSDGGTVQFMGGTMIPRSGR